MGYSRLAAFAVLMLTASAMIDARFQSTTTPTIMNLELLEAEMKALASLREIERAIGSKMKQNLIAAEDHCMPAGHICSPDASEHCCSSTCVPHPIKRIFVCGEKASS